MTIKEMKKQYIITVLEKFEGNRRRTAEFLGMKHRNFYSYLARAGIEMEWTTSDIYIVCAVCGNEKLANNGTQKYCGSKCYATAQTKWHRSGLTQRPKHHMKKTSSPGP